MKHPAPRRLSHGRECYCQMRVRSWTTVCAAPIPMCKPAHLGRTMRLIDCDTVQPSSLRTCWSGPACVRHERR